MLSRYIIAVVIVWAIILTIVKFSGSSERFRHVDILRRFYDRNACHVDSRSRL